MRKLRAHTEAVTRWWWHRAAFEGLHCCIFRSQMEHLALCEVFPGPQDDSRKAQVAPTRRSLWCHWISVRRSKGLVRVTGDLILPSCTNDDANISVQQISTCRGVLFVLSQVLDFDLCDLSMHEISYSLGHECSLCQPTQQSTCLTPSWAQQKK
jgi:hypothetical protein